MSTPDPSQAHPQSSSSPRFLSLDRLSLLRRALIVIGMAGPVAVWVREISRSHKDGPAAAIMLVPVLLSVILVNLNHTGAQILARGIWWFNLLFGTVAIGRPGKSFRQDASRAYFLTHELRGRYR